MKIVFLGATTFSEAMLLHLLDNKVEIGLIFTIPREFNISYSESKVKNYNYANLEEIASSHGIPCHYVESKEGKALSAYYDLISDYEPDLILVMGWYYMIPKKVRERPTYGTWGIHASMLPEYAGGAPLVWAMIEGRKSTGVTLFRLHEGVDDGDIIAQKEFPISDDETIREVYDKAIACSKEILLEAIQHIDKVKFIQQDKSKIKIYPQRSPDDGEIDLSWPSERIYNFIRAQAPPYPGAFIRTADGKKLIIEKAKIE